MKKVKAASVLLAISLVTASLAACGGGNNNSGTSTPPATSESTPPKTEEPKSDPVTLSFVISNTEDTTAYNKVFEAYEAKTGNKVELQALPGGDYDNMIKTRFSTGDFPDLFLMQPGTKQYVKLRAEETLHEWSGEQGVWDNVIDSIKEAQVENGKIYGVPYGSTGMMGVFYNKDVFKQAGVDVPQNYADMIEIAKKIKAAGFTPFYEGVKDAWPPQVFYFTGWVTQVDPVIGDEGVAKLNRNELALADIAELKDLFAKQLELKELGLYQDNVMAGTYDEMQNELGDGKVGMVFMLDGIVSQLEQKFGKDWVTNNLGFFPFPSATDQGTAMITPPNQLMVPEKAKHRDAAMELVRFMLEPANVDLFYASKPGIPIYQGATSELYPVQEDVKAYIDAGKSRVNIQNRLTASFVDFSKTLQNFFLNGNIDQAIQEFSANYQKDGKAKQLEGF
ncbi:hypothetical protein PA598K_00549 [Paenibacillus sp. 598K]|uniref:ABC transporter substrate-binding protein n=1 Tax=Paenibacillus sp. 598K TaxID=1117987 RepID=UPI000FF99870|nr:ABC transporter substrate-binding protein [Paenibacillus sp. 598K]GBF72309.1 hypothetical protein PA598K_00549 [Paenibacillus sp. 598K]